MGWAFLFMVLATVTALSIIVRGAVFYDGLSLLAVVFVLLSLLSLGLSRLAERVLRRRRRARWVRR